MNNKSGQASRASSKTSSAFVRPSIKRGLSLLGTSGLVLGIGVAGGSPAAATIPPAFECTDDNTVSPGASPILSRQAIESLIDDQNQICLDGNFVVDGAVMFDKDLHFYGLGDSSIDGAGNEVFQSVEREFGSATYSDNYLNEESGLNQANHVRLPVDIDTQWFANNFGQSPDAVTITFNDDTSVKTLTVYETDANFVVFQWDSGLMNKSFEETFPLTITTTDPNDGEVKLLDITIENLTVSNGGGSSHAVKAHNVYILDSTFQENTAGAIHGEGNVEVANSTFVNNSNISQGEESDGGAILGSFNINAGVEIYNSTFIGNSARYGGAVSAYFVDIQNSTFVDNEALGEGALGGAVYTFGGDIYFNTFVNNLAPVPSDDETPGNAVYKINAAEVPAYIGGNIFAGISSYPQLGMATEDPLFFFADDGPNVFSTENEEGISEIDPSSVFGASLTSIFGTSSPELATYQPNTFGTQTIGLAAGSPALDIISEEMEMFGIPETDQRGAPRSFPMDAGAFEGTASAPSTGTGSNSLAKTGADNPIWIAMLSSALLGLGALASTVTLRLKKRKV